MNRTLRWIFLATVIAPALCASVATQRAEDIERSAAIIKRMRGDIQRKTLQVLVLLKNLDTTDATAKSKVVVAVPAASVFESNVATARVLYTARLNEEFFTIERRDEWFLISLADNRRGWMREADVQFLSTQDQSPTSNPAFRDDAIQICARLQDEIRLHHDSALALMRDIDDDYRQLSPDERARAAAAYAGISHERDKIGEFTEYVRIFFAKYAADATRRTSADGTRAIPINAMLNVQMGNSSYNTTYDPNLRRSAISRAIDLTGGAQLSDLSTVNAAVNHKSTILQTPYSSNDLRLGYAYRMPGGLDVESYATVGAYSDDSVKTNSFTHTGAGATLRYPLSSTATLAADASYAGRSFKESKENDYQGIQFLSHLKWRTDARSDWTIGLNGSVQSSDISYMKFNRIVPALSYATRSDGKSFSLKAEGELLSYTSDAKINDYSREQLDLAWSSGALQQIVSVSSKQFANNSMLNYVRAHGQLRWTEQTTGSFTRNNLSLLYNYFLKKNTFQVDYTDFRMDHASGGGATYFDLNFYNRYWLMSGDSITRDHVIDVFARGGINLPYVQVGPIVGAHLLARKTEKLIARDGNSLRAGIEASTTFTLYMATISFSARYEKNFVYGREISVNSSTGETTFGELRERHPTTVQFSGRLRMPVMASLEFTLDVNRYDVSSDLDNTLSINPYERRMQFNMLAGLNYRIGM